MPSFLFAISFLLHIILLIAVYYLFQQIQSLKKDHAKELTDLFEIYLEDIKNENKRLEEILSHESQEDKGARTSRPMVSNLINKAEIAKKTEENNPILTVDNIEDTFETTLEAQVLQLYNEGIAIENIAKRLNCGKTEAALIVNLYEKRNHKA